MYLARSSRFRCPFFPRSANCARSNPHRAAADRTSEEAAGFALNSLLFHFSPQLFEKNTLVRGMLIDQNKPIGILHQDVEFIEHADDLELLPVAIGSARDRR